MNGRPSCRTTARVVSKVRPMGERESCGESGCVEWILIEVFSVCIDFDDNIDAITQLNSKNRKISLQLTPKLNGSW